MHQEGLPKPAADQAMVQKSQLETKDDFGKMVRRIVYSNSGTFLAIGSDGLPIKEKPLVFVDNKEWRRCKEAAESATQKGNFVQAETMWLHALAEAKLFPENDFRRAYTLENIASLYSLTGRSEQAEMFCLKALESLKAIYGVTHVRVAHCMNNLAGIYYNQGRHNDAEPLCLRVLNVYENNYGPDHADVGMVANNLAMLYHSIGELEQAGKMYVRALRIRTKVYGEDHQIVLTLRENFKNLSQSLRSTREFYVTAKRTTLAERLSGKGAA